MTPNKINARAAVAVHGEYKLIRRKALHLENGDVVAGDIVEETPWCKNVLTLYYFNQAMTVSSISVGGCVVGSGNTTPVESDSALQSYIGGTSTLQSPHSYTNNSTISPRYTRLSVTYRFGEGVAAGNIAEVGMTIASASFSAATPIISRALVVDGGGIPTSVTVLSDEFLDVVWQCTWYIPEDVTGLVSLTIDGVPTVYNYTIRGVSLNSSRWGAISGGTPRIGAYRPIVSSSDGNHSPGFQSGASTQTTLAPYDDQFNTFANGRAESITSAAYVADSKQREHTLRWGLNYANFDISSILISLGGTPVGSLGLGAFQVLLDPPIPKTSFQIFEFSFMLSLANAP